MLKKVISGIVFIILLTTTFTLRLDTQLIEAEPRTWTVNYDGSVEFKKTSDTITMADVADDSRASIRHGLRPTSRAFFENGLDTRLTDISQLSFEASSKWVLNNESKWDDSACIDDDSVELVIGFDDIQLNSYSELVDLTRSCNGKIVNTVSMGEEISAVVADMPHEDVLSFLSKVKFSGLSRYVEPNVRFNADYVPNDPDWSKQWGSMKIEADAAWNIQIGDSSVLVAIIDSGVDWDHPDLAANYVSLGYDWVNNDPDPMDDYGHGTHCAGIIAAVLSNGVGMAGLAQVRVMAEKGLDSGGVGRSDDLAKAIVHAVDQGADILSCSWGSYAKSTVVHEALEYAYDRGVLIVGAAGNDATSVEHYPAAYDEVIAVTATDEFDDPAGFTNFGDWVEVAAPGVHVYSTVWDDSYMRMSGTSMSAPHVSGVAALIWSQSPNMTRDQVRVQLRYTADDLGDSGFDIYYGYGRINARKAVEEVLPDHDIVVLNCKKSQCVNLGDQTAINTTILNMGTSDESDITVQLLVNDSVVDSKIVSSLVSGASVLVSCSWLPTVEGVYNVTFYIVPVPGETIMENNALVTLTLARIPEVIRVPFDYDTIQEAIDAAFIGDTIFVASGIYSEDVWMDKEGLKLIGEDVDSTIIDDAEVVVAADNVNVNGFTIRNGDVGIVTYCSKGSIINNTRTLNNEIGIYLLFSSNIVLANNNMSGNSNNLDVDGYCLNDFIHNVNTSNLADGKSMYYWINEHNRQVPSDAGYVAVINSTKIVIQNLNLTGNGEGVLLAYTNNSIIENVNALNNYDGICLAHSNTNRVIGCIMKNGTNGVHLYQSESNNVSHNLIIDNEYGISSDYASDNKISFNKAVNNSLGILLGKSDDNVINANELLNNRYGLYLEKSSCNTVKNNNMTGNEYNFGIIGSYLSHFIHDIDTSNLVNSKPTYYLLNQKDKEIPLDAGYVAVVNSTSIVVRNLNLTNNVNGVLFAYTAESLVEDVNAMNNVYGIYLYSSSNNTIVYNAVTSKSKRGIQLINSNNNTISKNTIMNNSIGIGLWMFAENNAISNNTISNCTMGLYLDHSRNTTIKNNLIKNNYDGVWVYCSSDCTLRDNNITGNEHNIYIEDGARYILSYFIQDIDSSNTVDGKPVYYLVNQHDRQIPTDAGYVAVVNSTNITIRDLNLTKNGQGILFVYANNSNVENVNVSKNLVGMDIGFSRGNTFFDNAISNNNIGIWAGYSDSNSFKHISITGPEVGLFTFGIFLADSNDNFIIENTVEQVFFGLGLTASNCNTISNNTLNNNKRSIHLEYSSSNTISYNVISNNGFEGIRLQDSDCNTINNNTITNNDIGVNPVRSRGNTIGNNIVTGNRHGILMAESGNNTISNNIVAGNEIGIEMVLSNDTNIYHNSFINKKQVITNRSVNIWDNDYPNGGNYWSDYTGADEFSGPNQDEPSSDGIGDTPYDIDENNRDKYPLMNPFLLYEHDLAVALWAPVSLISGNTTNIEVSVYNLGLGDESELELQLLIDGIILNSETIPELTSGSVYTLHHSWTPTINDGACGSAGDRNYNVTVYIIPVSGEYTTANNMKSVTVRAYKPVEGPTTVLVCPVESNVLVGCTLTINVTIVDVVDLYGWGVKLLFNATQLECTDVSIPPTNIFAGFQYFSTSPEINNDDGTVLLGCTLIGERPGVNGTGVLMTIEFKAKTPGSSTLEFNSVWPNPTMIISSNITEIVFETHNGYVTVTKLIGDLNNDGEVDMKDIAIAAMAFGSYPGHPRWNLIVDINQDNHVDMRDIALIARNFGKTC